MLVIHANGRESFGHFGLGGDVLWISSDGDNPMNEGKMKTKKNPSTKI